MPKPIKYYIGNVEIRNGEYTYESVIRFKTRGNPSRYLRKLAASWYADEGALDDGQDGAYYFDAGCVCVQEGAFQELTQEVYQVLTLLIEL